MSQIDCAFYGFVAADAEPRVSQAGKAWTRVRVGVGKDEAVQWLSVAVFGKAAEVAATLKKQDRIYCEGTLKLDTWRDKAGAEKSGLSVATFRLEKTHQIGRARPPRDRTADRPTRTAPADNDLNDDLSF